METEISNSISRKRCYQGLIAFLFGAALLSILRFLLFSSSSARSDSDINLPVPQLKVGLAKLTPVKQALGNAYAFHAADSCNMASINGVNYDKEITLPAKSTVGLEGWLIDKPDRNNAPDASLNIANVATQELYQVPISFRTRRPDVQDYFHGPKGFAYAGFLSVFDGSTLPAGKYHLFITYDVKGERYTCDDGRLLILDKPDA